MKSSPFSANDTLIENTISTILAHLGHKIENNLGKYVSRDHTSGNLLFPYSASRNPSTLAEILGDNENDIFSIDNVKIDSNLNILKVFLNQSYGFRTSLKTVADYAGAYGAKFSSDLKFQIKEPSQSFEESGQLSLYRLRVSCVILRRFLLFVDGGKNMDGKSERRQEGCEIKNISLCNHRTRIQKCSQTIHIVCRSEVNQLNGAKNLDISYEDYKRLREKDVRRNDDFTDDDSSKISRIVDASISFDLLTTKINMPVHLNLDTNRTTSRNSSSKGAIFVLYTYARLAAIVKKFEEFVQEKLIDVPDILETDFSLLTNSDEKVILYNYILLFPVITKEIWLDLSTKEEFHIHKLCLFLGQFSSIISKYYRSTRVLMTQTPNLFPSMFARIHLIRAALQVLKNGLNCLNIEPLSEM